MATFSKVFNGIIYSTSFGASPFEAITSPADELVEGVGILTCPTPPFCLACFTIILYPLCSACVACQEIFGVTYTT